MKKILIISFICCMLCAMDVMAAPANRHQEQSAQMKAMQQLKIEALIEALEIAPRKKGAFKDLYIQYDDAVNEAGSSHVRAINNINKFNPDELTQEQVKQSILSQLELSRELIEIKSVYFERFNAILTPKQMLDFYRTESAISNRIKREFKRRLKEDRAPNQAPQNR